MALTVLLVVVISVLNIAHCTKCKINQPRTSKQPTLNKKEHIQNTQRKERKIRRKCAKIEMLSLFAEAVMASIQIITHAYCMAHAKHTQHLCAWSPRSRSRSMSIVRLMSAAHISHVHNLQFIHRYAHYTQLHTHRVLRAHIPFICWVQDLYVRNVPISNIWRSCWLPGKWISG